MREAVDVAERVYALARKGDRIGVRELIADDATWDPAAKAKWKPCSDGDQILQTLIWRASHANRLKLAEPIDLGPLAVIRLRGKRLERLGARGLIPKLFQIVEVRDGKIVRMRDFSRREEALVAAGLKV